MQNLVERAILKYKERYELSPLAEAHLRYCLADINEVHVNRDIDYKNTLRDNEFLHWRIEQLEKNAHAMDEDGVRSLVRDAVEQIGCTQEEYAKTKDYSPQYLCDFLNERRMPGKKILNGEGLIAKTIYIVDKTK